MRISNLCLYLVSSERFWFLLGRYRLNPAPNLNLSKVRVQQKIFNFDPIFLQIALLTSLYHGNSKLVARFGIGWAVLICIGNLRTYRQTDGQTHCSNYNIDVEGYVEVKNLHFWSNFSANSFIKSILIFSFQICAWIWYRVNGFDFYLDVTDLTLTLPLTYQMLRYNEKSSILIQSFCKWLC